MRRLSLLVFTVAALCAVTVPASALAADCPGSDLLPAQDNIAEVAQATLCLLNAERAANGLPSLTEQHQLTSASVQFSQLMVDQKFFAHDAPDGTTLVTRLERSGYLAEPSSWTVGENIAWGESYLASPQSIVKAWMDSPPHRENVLSADFDEIGLGIVTGVPVSSNPGATYTTDFGRRTLDQDTAETEVIEADDEAPPVADPEPAVVAKRSASKSARERKASTRRAIRAARRTTKRSTRRGKNGRRVLSMRAIRTTVAH